MDQTYWPTNGKVGWTYSNSSYGGTITSVELGGLSIPYRSGEATQSWVSSNGTSLSSCYPNVNARNPGTAPLAITPASGYYVTRVVIACCCSGQASAFNCATWKNQKAYDEGFTLHGTTLEINLSSVNFCHDSNDKGNVGYYIIIETAPIPDPLYVQYFPGIMDGKDGFEGENWLVLNDAEYRYTKDSTTYRHTADDVDADLQYVELNGEYYQFDGWKREYYSDYSSGGTSPYTVTLSDHQSGYDTYINSGAEFTLIAHTKLIAQWVKVDIPLGTLTITKSFNDGFTAIPSGLSFVITYPDGSSVMVPYTDFVGGSYTIRGVPVGTYTVTETNAAVEGYTHTQTITVTNENDSMGAVSDTASANGTVYDDETTTFAVANNYSEETAALSLHKHFAGETVAVPEGLTFTVTSVKTDENGEPVYEETIPYTSFVQSEHGGYVILQDLPLGEYVITETGADVSGYERTVTVSVDDGDKAAVANDAANVTLAAGTHTVVLENSYEPVVRDVTVKKTFTGLDASLVPADFAITIYDGYNSGNVVDVLTLNEAVLNDAGEYIWTVALEVLPNLGQYYFVESGAAVENYEYTVMVGGTESSGGDCMYYVHPTVGYPVVEFENIYERTVGDLVVTKNFVCEEHGSHSFADGTDAMATLNKYFAIHVEDADGRQVKHLTIANADAGSSGSYTWTITDLPEGTYTVTETGYGLEHHSNTATVIVNDGEAVLTTSVSAAIAADETTTVAFTNTYEDSPRVIVDIPVSKTVETNGSVTPADETFLFNVVVTWEDGVQDEPSDLFMFVAEKEAHAAQPGEGADYSFTLGSNKSGHLAISGTADDFNNIKSIAITEVDAGKAYWKYDKTVYTVTFEYDSNNDDWYELIRKDDGAAVSNQGEDKAETAFVNTYDEKLLSVDIPVEKVVLSRGNVAVEGRNTFDFLLDTADFSGLSEYFEVIWNGKTITEKGEFSLEVEGEGSASGYLTVTGRASDLNGLSLNIREIADQAPAYWSYDNAEWTAEISVTGGTAVVEEYYQDGSAVESSIRFTNAYEKVKAALPGSKIVSVAEGSFGLPAGTYTFDFTMYTDPVEALKNFEIDWSEAENITPIDGGFRVVLTLEEALAAGKEVSVDGDVYIIGSASDFEGLKIYIREDASNVPAYWTYAQKGWRVELGADDELGWKAPVITMTEEGSSAASDSIVFVNTYDDEVFQLPVELTKNLLDKALEEDATFKFVFALQNFGSYTGIWDSEEYNTFAVRVNDEWLDMADGEDTFTLTVPAGEVTASADITIYGSSKVLQEILSHYWITIREVAEDSTNWIYDENVWKASPISTGSGWRLSDTTAEFTNRFRLYEVSFPVKKTVSGDPLPEDKTFHFIFGAADASSLSSDFGYSYTGENVRDGADFGNTGAFLTIPAGESEGEFTVTVTGTAADLEAFFPVTVRESDTGDATITYDETEWTVKLEKNNQTGEYTTKIPTGILNLGKADAVSFINEYTEPVYEVTIPVEKLVVSDTALGETEFGFALDVTYAESSSRTEYFSIVFNADAVSYEDGEADFGLKTDVIEGLARKSASVTITGTLSDLRSITGIGLSEIVPADLADGWTYDTSAYNVTLSYDPVEDIWTANVPAAGVTFENTYELPRGDLIITKDFLCLTHEHSFEDENSAMEDLEEYFAIDVYDEAGELVKILRVADADAGSGAGRYTWTLKDLPLGTYTVTETGYGLNHHTVAIEMNGVAVAEPTVSAVIAKNSDGKVEITNTYEESERHIVRIPVSKTVKQLGDVVPAGETFLFNVAVDWVDDSIDHSGVYRLVAEVAALETAAGSGADYSFTLTTNGGAAEETVSGYLAISGTVEDFENIASITITEQDAGKAYWTYDETVWEFVTGTSEGGHPTVLHTNGSAVGKEAPAAFTNGYDEDLRQITIPVEKTVSGDPLPEDTTFTFALTGYDTATLSRYFAVKAGDADITADGRFTVTVSAGEVKTATAVVITGTEADLRAITNWKLNICEEGTSDSIWTYDETVWEVNIAVADETIKIRKQGKPLENITSNYEAVTFENVYDEPVYTMTIPVSKMLIGESVGKKTAFTFHVTAYWQDFDGMSAADLSADFSIRFQGENVKAGSENAFILTVPADAKTAEASVVITGTAKDFTEVLYGLYISEDTSDVPEYWTFDRGMWWITPAEENADGVWDVVITNPDKEMAEGVTFVNEYDPPDEPGAPKTGDNSHLALWGLMMVISAAALCVVLTMSRKRRRDG